MQTKRVRVDLEALHPYHPSKTTAELVLNKDIRCEAEITCNVNRRMESKQGHQKMKELPRLEEKIYSLRKCTSTRLT